MDWQISFTVSAEKEFEKLTHEIKKRIRDYLRYKVCISPREYGKPMQGSKSIKLWRYRIGNYRMICQIKDIEITVLVVKIGKRDSVYDHLLF